MEYLQIDDHTHLERIRMAHAGIVFEAIAANRHFLRRWLPFVDQTRTLEDTRQYIKMLLSAPEKNRNEVFTLWYRGSLPDWRDSRRWILSITGPK